MNPAHTFFHERFGFASFRPDQKAVIAPPFAGSLGPRCISNRVIPPALRWRERAAELAMAGNQS